MMILTSNPNKKGNKNNKIIAALIVGIIAVSILIAVMIGNKNGYTRTGYTFSKWNTKANGSGTNYTNQQSVKNLTTVNGGTFYLYAQWTPNTYTVKFNGNGATSGSTASMSMTYDVFCCLYNE